jgi:hypothetical protein
VSAWRRLDRELDCWDAAGRQADLWCRDDDACRDSPALARLFDVALGGNVPVALAVIPALIEPSLDDAVAKAKIATVVQHGYAHRNHAAPGARNWELGSHRPVAESIAELALGRDRLQQRFGPRFVPVLVPPWNRIDSGVIDLLPGARFLGLSTFGPRPKQNPVAGLVQCNTHIDLVAWRRDRAFIGVEPALDRVVAHLAARREGTADPAEPTGILTHHLDFDAAAWTFFEDLVARTRQHGAATWVDVRTAFDGFTSGRSA